MSYPAILWYYVSSFWSRHSQGRVCYWSGDGAQSQNYQIGPLEKEWQVQDLLLINCHNFISLPLIRHRRQVSPDPSLIGWHSITSWWRKFKDHWSRATAPSTGYTPDDRDLGQEEEKQSSRRDEELIGCGLNHWLQIRLLLSNIALTRCYIFNRKLKAGKFTVNVDQKVDFTIS